MLDSEVFRTMVRDACNDRLREAARDELARHAVETPATASAPRMLGRMLAALLDMSNIMPRLRPLVRRAIG